MAGTAFFPLLSGVVGDRTGLWRDAIADRLISCVDIDFTEGKPTLQSPKCVLETLIHLEYMFKNGPSTYLLDTISKEITESGGLVDYWAEWITNINNESDRFACIQGLVEAINECWEIGATYTFSLFLR